MGKMVQVTNC